MGLQTINDVALGITQAGLSRYLNRRYGKFSSSFFLFFFLLRQKSYMRSVPLDQMFNGPIGMV